MQKKQKAVYRLSLLKKSKETNEEMQVEKDLRMIIEDEWGEDLEKLTHTNDFDVREFQRGEGVHSEISFLEVRQEYMNLTQHYNLRNDLIKHLWDLKYGKKKLK